MFDLVTGKVNRPFRDRAPLSKAVAITVHVIVLGGLIAIPLLRATDSLPPIALPMVMAFTTAAPPPPPPPPPAPPAQPAAARAAARPAPKAAVTLPAPVTAPSTIAPEPLVASQEPAGVPGGIAGGTVGTIVAGLPTQAPPPPPPPLEPVRVGGRITAPNVVHQVNPDYPAMALAAGIEGLVILEAVVDGTGRVESVKVLRSGGRFLDAAAVTALKQWRYSPLVLNGTTSVPFVLTVTFNFNTKTATAAAH
jgi:protein TonB